MVSPNLSSLCFPPANDDTASVAATLRPERQGDEADEARLNDLMARLYAADGDSLWPGAGDRVSPFGQVAQAKVWVTRCIRRLQSDWEADRRSYNEISTAFRRLEQALLSDLKAGAAQARVAMAEPLGRVLIVMAPQCSHVMGAALVAAHFEAHGWQVQWPQAVDASDILDGVRLAHVDVVGISVGHDHALLDLAQLIGDLRRVSINPALKIVLGGQAFSLGRNEYQWLGADHIAVDEHDALQFCHRMVHSQRH
jgi:methylmalonyl-CoA mutase cobalamin-binding subunit